MPLDEKTFRRVLSCFPTGVTVMTSARADGSLVGVTVSAFAPVSLNPPLVLFCLDKRTASLETFLDGFFGVNVLAQDQSQVSNMFARRNEEKWQGISRRDSEYGVPLIDGCVAHLECQVHDVLEGGDHKVIIGHALRLDLFQEKHPLLYFRSAYYALGNNL